MIRPLLAGLAALALVMLGKYVPYWPLGLAPTAAYLAGLAVVPTVALFAAATLSERRWRALAVAAALLAAHQGLHALRPHVEQAAHRLLIALNDDPLGAPVNPFLTVDVERGPRRAHVDVGTASLEDLEARPRPRWTRFTFYDEPLAGASFLLFSAEGTAGLPEGSFDVPVVYDAHWSWRQAERL